MDNGFNIMKESEEFHPLTHNPFHPTRGQSIFEYVRQQNLRKTLRL